MRILRTFLLAIWLVPAAATAQGTPAGDQGDEETEGYFYAGLAALVELPTQIQGSSYQLGAGASSPAVTPLTTLGRSRSKWTAFTFTA